MKNLINQARLNGNKQNLLVFQAGWFLALLAFSLGCNVQVNATETSYTNTTQQILQMHTFREGLVWVGDKAPREAENHELLQTLNHLDEAGWTTGIEQFLKDHPESPWAASLHFDYASFCRRTGRTSKALEHFEAAWALAKIDTDPAGQRLSGAILANWTDLLSSLGRIEKLKELVAVGDQWHFVDVQDYNKYQGAKGSFYLMRLHPEMAYRCGTFALKEVGGMMQPENQSLESLVEVPSPTNGFSMAGLVDIAKQYGLDVVAVRRPSGQDLVVPSVIHWRQNHYAAVLKHKDDLYLVSDPTFGQQKWLSAEAIDEEASGEFIIPAALQTNGWPQLALNEAKSIHGMGLPNNINDGKDKGCKPGGPCPPCTGMPVWWVSEPYINVWIADEPISYLTSRGTPFTFRMTYKQRDTRVGETLVANTGWNHSWYSYTHLDSQVPFYIHSIPQLASSTAAVYLPNGGEVDFAEGQSYDPETRLLLLQQNPELQLTLYGDAGDNGLRLAHADGSQEIYGLGVVFSVPFGDYPESDYLLSRHLDANGDTTWFDHDAINLSAYVVTFVVDPDGLTNILTYTTNNLLSSVTNAYGQSAHFLYDSKGNLTNIVDATGLSSSLTYDTNGYPTRLITPYGTNQFSIVQNVLAGLGNFGGDETDNPIQRAALISDPVGANYLYMYRYDCSALLPTTYPSSRVPTGTPLGSLDDGTTGTNFLTGVCYRNSFYWGPRQYPLLSTTNIYSFTANDLLRGRMKHWLEDTNQLFLTDYLSVEQDASPDGSTAGLDTFYDYKGKLSGYNYCAGTYPLPSVVAWRLPSGETHYQYKIYDYFGNVTNLISTYTLSNGSVGTRTNQFIYADNTYTYLLGTWNGSGIINSVSTYYTIPDLLTKVVGADGNAIWTYGGFDTVTWTNFFYTGSQTNGTTLTSSRVLPDYATNGVGLVSTNTYTAGGKPISFYDLYQGTPTATNYDYGTWLATSFPGYSKVSSTRSVAGLLTTNFFDGNGFLVKTIDLQISRTNSFTYTTDGLIGSLTNELGLKLAVTWDNLLRLTGVQFPDGTYVSNVFNRLDLGGMRDRLGRWTYYGYDGARRLTSTTNANNAVTTYDWCGCGALTDIIDALTNITTFSYDNQGNLTNISFPDSSTLNYQYDLATRRISATDGASRTWHFGYDNQGLITVVTNAYGQAKGVSYDIRDRQVTVTNADNVYVNNTFDPLDRILTRTWPNSTTEGFGYSVQGLAFYTNQLIQVTSYGRDTAMRITAETNANLETTSFTYDPANDLLTLKDGKNQTTTWTYNIYGNLSNKVDAANNLLFVYIYDPNNRLTNRWSATKGTTTYLYDPVGNLTNIVYPGSPSIALKYDPLNRLTNMVDAVGTMTYTYSQVGQLSSEDGPWANDTVSYTYAQQLRTALSLSQPSGSWSQSYGFDNARRLNSLTSPAGTFGYGYFAPASLLPVLVTLPNSAYITNSYDALARLMGTVLKNSGNTTLDSETYTYDAGNERTQQVFTAGNFVNYGYDAIGQLKSAIGKESGGTLVRQQEKWGYAYDAAHNLNYRTNNALVQTFAVNNLNELTTVTNSGTLTVAGTTTVPAANVTVNGQPANRYADATFALGGFAVNNGNNSFTAVASDVAGNIGTNSVTVNLPATNNCLYDLNGNLTSDGKRGFDYDDENELIRVTVTNTFKKEYVYDGKRRLRIRKEFTWSGAWAQTNEIHYIYDGDVVIQQRDTNNVPTLTFTRGVDLSGRLQNAGGIGGLLAMTESSGTQSYYHSDGNGNVMALIATNQLLVAKYEYDPFGNPLSISGPKAFVNPDWFSSQLYDPDTDLYHYRFRAYAPELQRWLNRDPIGERGGINLYDYIANNPINYVDPFGLVDLFLLGPNTPHKKDMDAISDPSAYTVGSHGNPYVIADQNGQLDDAAALLDRMKKAGYQGGPIKLFACETGADPNGLAQQLANLANTSVSAPNKDLFTNPNGQYAVYGSNSDGTPNSSDPGTFVTFVPRYSGPTSLVSRNSPSVY
jgi:RHS repeat-associated protein